MLIAFGYAIVRTCDQNRYPSAGEWIMKLWIIHTVEFHSIVRRNEFMQSAGKWLDLGSIRVIKVTQTQKDKGTFSPLYADPGL